MKAATVRRVFSASPGRRGVTGATAVRGGTTPLYCQTLKGDKARGQIDQIGSSARQPVQQAGHGPVPGETLEMQRIWWRAGSPARGHWTQPGRLASVLAARKTPAAQPVLAEISSAWNWAWLIASVLAERRPDRNRQVRILEAKANSSARQPPARLRRPPVPVKGDVALRAGPGQNGATWMPTCWCWSVVPCPPSL